MLDRLIRTTEQNAHSRRDFLSTIAKAAAGSLLLAGCYSTPKKLQRPSVTKYNTIAHEFLDMELEFGATISDYELLDDIIDKAKEAVWSFDEREKIYPVEAITALQSIDKLLEDFGFEYQKNGLLNTGLKQTHLDCSAYSIIYTAIGEALKLPIHFVRAPRHTFVRWKFNDGSYVNWETTNGEERTDEHYIEEYNIPKVAKGKVYLKSLSPIENRKEIISTQHVNVGTEKYYKCKMISARNDFIKAAKADPYYCEAYYNIGVTFQFLEEYDDAIKYYNMALRLNPNHTNTLSGLMNTNKEKGKKKEAEEFHARILEIDPEYFKRKKERPRRRMECNLSPSR